ncbi:hypothetical protein CHUAL_006906 [Chamberlinius hualienensis]
MRTITNFLLLLTVMTAFLENVHGKEAIKLRSERNKIEDKVDFKAVAKREGILGNIYPAIKNFFGLICNSLGYGKNVTNSVNPCSNNPCKYGGKCAAVVGENDFQCYDCPYPMGGKDCAELHCGGIECFRHRDTVFFVYRTNCNFYAAQVNCDAYGQSMAMLKDNATHQAVRDYFSNKYPNKKFPKHAFWIGLLRRTIRDPFLWKDNTGLDSYQGWAEGKPTSNNEMYCASIGNGELWNWLWSDVLCNGSQGLEGTFFYPLCQKTYPFLA